jgi:thiol-disulfide isomerase/thioredoxin
MSRYRILFAAAAMASVAALPAAAAPLLEVTSISSLNELSVPARPYDEDADADAAVDAAFARATAEHKLVLIDLGGNWCADCRIFAGVMELPEVRRFVEAHYVTVNVDVGRADMNLQIPARFGIKARIDELPSVLIAEPDGTLVDRGHMAALADARAMTPQAIADWLAEWTK